MVFAVVSCGQSSWKRPSSQFGDPAFEPLAVELGKVAAAAWDGYSKYRKSPRTHKAGPGYADPNYDLPDDWRAARDAIERAQREYEDPAQPPCILIVNGSSRSEHTCPGEMSKSWRLTEIAAEICGTNGVKLEVLNLSRLAAEYGARIHPCKACFSTAAALCHWPCSCYPNYALGQTQDLMNSIYPLWIRAHGIMLITPVNWYHCSSPMKLMIDRMVCADGGNPDPSSTHGKDAKRAKQLELDGWPYPRHLAGRVFSVVVHGDAAGVDTLRESLTNWLTDMELIDAGNLSQLGAYLGYMRPYATSHDDLDRDTDLQAEVRNAARSLVVAVKQLRRGELKPPDAGLCEPRQK